MNIHEYLQVLRRGLLFIILGVVAGALLGGVVGRASPPQYQVAATVGVFAGGRASVGDLQQGAVFAQQAAPTYAQLATTDVVLTRAVSDMGGSTTVSALRSATRPVARNDSSLIDINASGGNAVQVAAMANAVATALGEVVPTVGGEARGSSLVPLDVITVTRARPPTKAYAPQPRYTTFVGVVIGLGLAILALVVRYSLDTRIRTAEDIPDRSRFLTKTTILRPAGRRRRFLLEGRLEAYRALRGTLQFGDSSQQTIAVAAVEASGSAAQVAEQFTEVLGETGSTALIIDADLRVPSKNGRGAQSVPTEGVPPGLTDALLNRKSLDSVIVRPKGSSVHSLSSGPVDDFSASLLSTTPMRSLLELLKHHYSYVVVTCPPMVSRSEAAVLAALADSTLLVIRSGHTRRQDLQFALELLDGVKASPISAIIEDVKESDLNAVRTRSG